MKITRESWVLAAIGIADLVTTIVFIEHHGAEEANPLFRHFWEMGLSVFILAKLALLACPLMVLEWARKRSPRFTLRALRGGIAAYILMYGVGFARLNNPQALANDMHSLDSGIRIEASGSLDPVSWKLSVEQMAALPYKHKNETHFQRIKRNAKNRIQQSRQIEKVTENLDPHPSLIGRADTHR
jgi:hypothetical protein